MPGLLDIFGGQPAQPQYDWMPKQPAPSAGLLTGLFGGPNSPVGGLLGGVGANLNTNQNAMAGYLSGALLPGSTQEKVARGMQGMTQGRMTDIMAQTRQDALNTQRAEKQAVGGWLDQMVKAGKISGPNAATILNNPEAIKELGKRLITPEFQHVEGNIFTSVPGQGFKFQGSVPKGKMIETVDAQGNKFPATYIDPSLATPGGALRYPQGGGPGAAPAPAAPAAPASPPVETVKGWPALDGGAPWPAPPPGGWPAAPAAVAPRAGAASAAPPFQTALGPGQVKTLEETGQRRGTAISDLPKALENAQFALTKIDDVLKHPGMYLGTGKTGVVAGKIWGSDAYDFQAQNAQLQGKAFLEAFQSLKGAGAISEGEGKAGTTAIAQLDTAQSYGQYKKALNDLREIVASGQRKALIQAGMDPSTTQGTLGPQPQIKTVRDAIGLPAQTRFVDPNGIPRKRILVRQAQPTGNPWDQFQRDESATPPAVGGVPQPNKEGWVDMGGGVRIRQRGM